MDAPSKIRAPLAIAFATSYGSRFAKQSQWRPVVRLSIIVAADVGLVASGDSIFRLWLRSCSCS